MPYPNVKYTEHTRDATVTLFLSILAIHKNALKANKNDRITFQITYAAQS